MTINTNCYRFFAKTCRPLYITANSTSYPKYHKLHSPDNLIREQLPIVLAAQVGFRGLRRVQLQRLADPLAQHV